MIANRIKTILIAGATALLSLTAVSTLLVTQPSYAASSCKNGDILGLPHWYDGLQNGDCSVTITGAGDIWIIVVNVVDIALRIVGVLAVVYTIWGGIKYITSQGEPARITSAKQTISHALIGLGIAIAAVIILQFIIGIFGLHTSGNTLNVSLVVIRSIYG